MTHFVSFALVRLLVAVSVMLTLAGPVSAADSRILSATYLSDPSVVDVMVTAVTFDPTTGNITVTGTVECAADFELFSLDFTATQARVSGPAVAFDACNGSFSQVITGTDGSFRPGRVTIQINALACGLNCGEEVLVIEAVLVPDDAG